MILLVRITYMNYSTNKPSNKKKARVAAISVPRSKAFMVTIVRKNQKDHMPVLELDLVQFPSIELLDFDLMNITYSNSK